MSPSEIALVVALVPVAVAVLGFWVWMLVDCLRYEGPTDLDRVLWLLVLVFLKFVGAALYYFLRYRSRPRTAAAPAA